MSRTTCWVHYILQIQSQIIRTVFTYALDECNYQFNQTVALLCRETLYIANLVLYLASVFAVPEHKLNTYPWSQYSLQNRSQCAFVSYRILIRLSRAHALPVVEGVPRCVVKERLLGPNGLRTFPSSSICERAAQWSVSLSISHEQKKIINN